MSTQLQYRYLLTSGNDVITVYVEGPAVQLVSCSNTSPTASSFPTWASGPTVQLVSCSNNSPTASSLPTWASVRWGPQSLLHGLWIKYRLANADWKTYHITSRLCCVISHVLISKYFSKLFTRTPDLHIINRKNNSNCNLKVLCIFIIFILYKQDHIKPYVLISRLSEFKKTNKNIHTQVAICLLSRK